PPPLRAATVSSLMMRVKIFPRLASAAPFLCLIVCHFEWPDMLGTPAKSRGSDGKSYHKDGSGQLAGQDDPDLGPLVPLSAAIVAEESLDEEPSPLQPAGHSPNRDGAKGEVEGMSGHLLTPTFDVSLLEDGQATFPILAD